MTRQVRVQVKLFMTLITYVLSWGWQMRQDSISTASRLFSAWEISCNQSLQIYIVYYSTEAQSCTQSHLTPSPSLSFLLSSPPSICVCCHCHCHLNAPLSDRAEIGKAVASRPRLSPPPPPRSPRESPPPVVCTQVFSSLSWVNPWAHVQYWVQK